MRAILFVPLFLVAVSSASGGEMFSGSHTYAGTATPWLPVPGAGYLTAKMVGTFTPDRGPIPKSRVECRGTSFWTDKTSEAEGVCVFGKLPDRWMLRYRMTAPPLRGQRIAQFSRSGEWTIIGGVGRYKGITGKGTYMAKSGVRKTHWAGEITIPK